VPQRRPGQDKAEEPDYTPICEHGTWTFAGVDYQHRATKWRCPTGECDPTSVWLPVSRRHPLIPYKEPPLEGSTPTASAPPSSAPSGASRATTASTSCAPAA
jgi:hypothetical protein